MRNGLLYHSRRRVIFNSLFDLSSVNTFSEYRLFHQTGILLHFKAKITHCSQCPYYLLVLYSHLWSSISISTWWPGNHNGKRSICRYNRESQLFEAEGDFSMLLRSRLLLLFGLLILFSGCHHHLAGYAVPLYQQPAGFSETYKQHLYANEPYVNAEYLNERCQNCETDQAKESQNLEEHFATNKGRSNFPVIATPNQAGGQMHEGNSMAYSPQVESIRSKRRDLIPNQTSPVSASATSQSSALASRRRLILQKY